MTKCVPTFLFIFDDTNSVNVISGESASLPCGIRPRSSTILVLWYKENDTSPIYSYDARSTEEPVHWIKKKILRNGAMLEVGSDVKLIIKNVSIEDGGVYRCRVDHKNAKTWNGRIVLNVITLSSSPTIKFFDGRKCTKVITSLKQGDMLELICEIQKELQISHVIWWNEDKMMSNHSLPNEMFAAKLQYGPLQRDDAGSNFTCQAVKFNSQQVISTSVTLHLQLKPLVANIKHDQYIMEGKYTSIQCEISGSFPTSIIRWQKNQKIARIDKIESRGNTSSSNFTFVPKMEDNGHDLICYGENPSFPEETVSDKLVLNVLYQPRLGIVNKTPFGKDEINEGKDVFLECQVDSNPRYDKLEWKHNGKTVGSNVSSGFVLNNQNLIIQKITETHSGNYSCLARNILGSFESHPFFLDVKFVPFCIPEQKIIYSVARTMEVMITCHLSSNPSITRFHWVFNHTMDLMRISSDHYTYHENYSALRYRPFSNADYGSVLCWGENRLGRQKIPCIFQILPDEFQERPQNCSIIFISSTSVTVKCDHALRFESSEKYLGQITSSSESCGSVRLNVSVSDPLLSIDGLCPDTSYVIKLHLEDFDNKSLQTEIEVKTLSLEVARQVTTANSGFKKNTPLISILVVITLSITAITASSIMLIWRLIHHRSTCKSRYSKSIASTKDKNTKKMVADFENKAQQALPSQNENILVIPKVSYENISEIGQLQFIYLGREIDTIDKNDKKNEQCTSTVSESKLTGSSRVALNRYGSGLLPVDFASRHTICLVESTV